MTSATFFAGDIRRRFIARFRTQRLLVAHIPSYKNRTNESLRFNWTILCYVKTRTALFNQGQKLEKFECELEAQEFLELTKHEL